MSDNLPAIRPTALPVARDTDSWVEVVKDVAMLAESVAKTTFVPEALRNNVPGTAAAILYGREIGLPTMTALQTTNVIKGRVGISAEIQRALVLAAGHEIEYREVNSGRCVIAGRRAGSDSWTEVAYSIDDAKTAGLLNNANYRNNPTDMLIARASTRLCRMLFPDVIRGMPSAEELEDIDEDGEPVPAATTARAKVQRKQRTTPKTDDGAVPNPPEPPSGAAPSSPPLPPLPGEPGYDSAPGSPELQGSSPARGTAVIADPDSDGILPVAEAEAPAVQSAAGDNRVPASAAEGDGEGAPSSSPEVKMSTRAQLKGLFGLFNSLGIVDDAERLQVTADLIGRMPMHRGEPSWNGLTWDEANGLTTMMSTAKNRDNVEALIELAELQRAGGDQP